MTVSAGAGSRDCGTTAHNLISPLSREWMKGTKQFETFMSCPNR
jgi:hypothetical protein